MKKIIFGIFAHPDDEAFGPCGTLLRETRTGADLHLITFTDGDAGTNPDNLPNLGEVRLKEWKEAGMLMGAKTMHHLGYKDGQLNNRAMIEASTRIKTIIAETLESAPSDAVIEFVTLDLNGYTGHIDHIVAARAASFVFYTLKQNDARFSHIKFACFPRLAVPSVNTDWIYMEAGHLPEEIQETVDARHLQDDIIDIMHIHHTQRSDGMAAIKNQGANLGLNYFIVKS
ncbi:MAG TPA: PIG-L family deacetylase [Candidatus Saccharimonadales bacterium]|nr:PIG-L family deacetylase [Candidatus Saccharimonadales bacterium]